MAFALLSLYNNKELLEKFIDHLPVELHWPGYHFLGPGTKLEERLQKGDKGINPLDEAAKQHDIAYASSKDIRNRLRADKVLEYKAWDRVNSSDAPFFGEKVPAYVTTNMMKVKGLLGAGLGRKRRGRRKAGTKVRKIAGSGLRRRKRRTKKCKKAGKCIGAGLKTKRRRRRGRGKNPRNFFGAGMRLDKRKRKKNKKNWGKLPFSKLLNTAKEQINPNQSLADNTVKMMAALRELKKNKHITNVKRILSVPKQGGALSLAPIIGAYSALKKIGKTVSAVITAINAVNDARKEIFGGKKGNGFVNINRNLALYRRGRGIVLKLR